MEMKSSFNWLLDLSVPRPPALLSAPGPHALLMFIIFFANSRQVAWFTFLIFGTVPLDDNQKVKVMLIKKVQAKNIIYRNILKDTIAIVYFAYFQTYQRLREVNPTKICSFLTSNWSEEGVSNITPLSVFFQILIQFKAN